VLCEALLEADRSGWLCGGGYCWIAAAQSSVGQSPLAGIFLFVSKEQALKHESVLSLLLQRSYAGPTISSK
jgi:hypothetical protein